MNYRNCLYCSYDLEPIPQGQGKTRCRRCGHVYAKNDPQFRSAPTQGQLAQLISVMETMLKLLHYQAIEKDGAPPPLNPESPSKFIHETSPTEKEDESEEG